MYLQIFSKSSVTLRFVVKNSTSPKILKWWWKHTFQEPNPILPWLIHSFNIEGNAFKQVSKTVDILHFKERCWDRPRFTVSLLPVTDVFWYHVRPFSKLFGQSTASFSFCEYSFYAVRSSSLHRPGRHSTILYYLLRELSRQQTTPDQIPDKTLSSFWTWVLEPTGHVPEAFAHPYHKNDHASCQEIVKEICAWAVQIAWQLRSHSKRIELFASGASAHEQFRPTTSRNHPFSTMRVLVLPLLRPFWPQWLPCYQLHSARDTKFASSIPSDATATYLWCMGSSCYTLWISDAVASSELALRSPNQPCRYPAPAFRLVKLAR